MSKESDKIVDFANVQLVSSFPNSLTVTKMRKIIKASIKSTLSENLGHQLQTTSFLLSMK